jgi:hypothetical protein
MYITLQYKSAILGSFELDLEKNVGHVKNDLCNTTINYK